jgi:hypothetical protein
MAELDDIVKGDSLLFHKRLNVIKNEIQQEIRADGPVSRDHFRTNNNGISLERIERTSKTKMVETFGKTTFGETQSPKIGRSKINSEMGNHTFKTTAR